MTKQLSILYFFLISASAIYSQHGYMHHKNHFDFALQGNLPLLSGSFKENEFVASGDKMVEKKDWLDYGAYFNYYHVKSKRFSLGVTAAIKFYELSMPAKYVSLYATDEFADNVVDTTYLRFESMSYKNYYFGPTFEFATRNGTSGIGFNYDLSAGVSISTLRNKSHAYSINNFSAEGEDDRWTDVDYYNTSLEWEPIYGVFVRTGFKVRYPLTKFMSIFTGLNYTIIVNYKPDTFVGSKDKEVFDSEEVYFRVQRENLITTTLDFGLTFYL